MCGFTGYYGFGNYDRKQILDAMGECIAHRGPDSDGTFLDDHVALGFRRLSIIDLEGGSQPIHSEDGRHVIVFNGEIYNYQDIRKELIEKHGCTFATHSDTEVILQAYKTYGEDAVKMLRGMFAFVIYDKETHTMFGARDQFGIKPFYYAKMNDTLLFGSEIKSFLPHPAFHKAVNKDALKMYLIFQYNPLEETMFKDVYKLEPGTCFTYDGSDFKVKRYFTFAFEETSRSLEETVECIHQSVKDSVAYHKIADVEVGSFLSGGVDSSYIASVLRPDKTYSVGFEVQGFDETTHARDLCETLHLKNKKKTLTSKDFFDALPKVQYYSDEPHANLSAVPLFYLSEMAVEDLKVVQSGEGADELFGGYDAYKEIKNDELYKKIVPAALRKKLGHWAKGRAEKRGMGFLQRNATSLEDSYIGQAFIMDNEDADEVMADGYKTALCYQDVTRPYFERVKEQDDLHKKMYLDMHLWLPHDILLKADKMTMAHSLELRVPFLDKEVWNLAKSLESEYCIKGEESKRAFRMAAMKNIPSDWGKRKKMGFPVPLRVWLREEAYYAKVKTMFEKPYAAEFFNQKLILQWLEDHKNNLGNYQRKIYTVYSFLLWYEQYFVLH